MHLFKRYNKETFNNNCGLKKVPADSGIQNGIQYTISGSSAATTKKYNSIALSSVVDW
jgi:hypothetical protein